MDPKTSAVYAEELTTRTALVMSAYYGLLAEGQPTEWIGGHEIVRWVDHHYPSAEAPGESLTLKVLQAAGLEHRGPGKPSLLSRAGDPAPPFCPPQAQATRSR